MEYEELTHKIIGCAYKVYNQLGFGFLESPGIEDNNFDDDYDGIVDESMFDGIDNDGDAGSYEEYDDLPF